MSLSRQSIVLSVVAFATLTSALFLRARSLEAADLESAKPLPPEVAGASEEPGESMAAISIPEGWEISVWAAEPDVANVVAFDVDGKGRIYVCETFRQNRGVTDNRGHDQKWLLADLSSKTVQDRIDYHKRLLGEAAITYAQHDDRVRRIADTDGDGRADQSVIVADGFNKLEEGTGAGVLAIGGDVYYTCIPKLWKLVDQDADGVADERVVLSNGYGVRVAFRGHDMHGLIRGYDGRLYFSIGDRGYYIRTADGKVLADPASGAVFRCELDGTGLEVYARGLRNPQELAFNDRGDWFTVDNNSDSGDQARVVHLLQDGDTGWRMYYQYLPDRGPFNRERIWEPANEEQPLSIVPPVENLTDGPSGLAYYPGTGFGDALTDTFLICDFRGGPSNSGIRSFKVAPQGATYQLAEDDQPIWTCLATDVAFGPDGALYVSDWVDGWDGLGKARIYRLTDPANGDSAVVKEVRQLLAGQWSSLESDALVTLLGHADRRVRLESQWELAARGEVDDLIATVAESSTDPKARLHAVWGLGQVARGLGEEDPAAKRVSQAVIDRIGDPDSDIAFAALQIAGEEQWGEAKDAARAALAGDDARVRYAAIDALGRIGDGTAIADVLKTSAGRDASDRAISHAASMYLSRAISIEQLAKLKSAKSDAARLMAVVALRRKSSGAVSEFLDDSNPRVVLEAARAIHDEPIEFGMVALAKRIGQPMHSDALVRRVLNANYRVGTPESAIALAKFATRSEVGEGMRIEALEMLGQWAEPGPLDRVLGDYRPIGPRELKDAVAAVTPQIDLLMAAPEKVRLQAIDTAAALGIKKISGALVSQIAESTRTSESRAKALLALLKLNPTAALKIAEALPAQETRGMLGLAALDVLAQQSGPAAIERFVLATQNAETRIQQRAWDILGGVQHEKADQAIQDAVEQYLGGKLDGRVHLNVVEAAGDRLPDELKTRLNGYREKVAQQEPLGQWLDSLSGGDVDRGKQLFFEKTELSCVRCHKVDRAGGEVGPNLTVIGKDRDPRYLLEAICLPDAQIAKGFETAVIVDVDGTVHSGILKTETDEFVELIISDGSLRRVPVDEIEARKKGKSSMPSDLHKFLTPRELRDLVAYLASLKVDPRGSDDVE